MTHHPGQRSPAPPLFEAEGCGDSTDLLTGTHVAFWVSAVDDDPNRGPGVLLDIVQLHAPATLTLPGQGIRNDLDHYRGEGSQLLARQRLTRADARQLAEALTVAAFIADTARPD